MRESNSTTTDARGNFKLDLPDAGPHLIRVDHQKAGYFHIAPPGTQSADIDVYDVAESVQGVSTEANVMRLETDQQGLHVTQSYFVKNDSAPPRTPSPEHPFLRDLSSSEKAHRSRPRPLWPLRGMPVASSPVPALGEKGHYTFLFPIRPGETRFQVELPASLHRQLQVFRAAAGNPGGECRHHHAQEHEVHRVGVYAISAGN